jgi:hypothetical protein
MQVVRIGSNLAEQQRLDAQERMVDKLRDAAWLLATQEELEGKLAEAVKQLKAAKKQLKVTEQQAAQQLKDANRRAAQQQREVQRAADQQVAAAQEAAKQEAVKVRQQAEQALAADKQQVAQQKAQVAQQQLEVKRLLRKAEADAGLVEELQQKLQSQGSKVRGARRQTCCDTWHITISVIAWQSIA